MKRARPLMTSGTLCVAVMIGCATTSKTEETLHLAQMDLKQCRAALEAETVKRVAYEKKLADYDSDLADAIAARERMNRRMKAYAAIAEKLHAAFDPGTFKIVMRDGRMVVQLPNRILYDFGRTRIKPRGKAVLIKLASVLKEVKDRELLVAGHTDNVPVKRKNRVYRSNWELSTLRSLAVINYLRARGADARQLAATGYGEHHPEDSNQTADGRARNRRTEFILMPRISEIPELPSGDFPSSATRRARADEEE